MARTTAGGTRAHGADGADHHAHILALRPPPPTPAGQPPAPLNRPGARRGARRCGSGRLLLLPPPGPGREATSNTNDTNHHRTRPCWRTADQEDMKKERAWKKAWPGVPKPYGNGGRMVATARPPALAPGAGFTQALPVLYRHGHSLPHADLTGPATWHSPICRGQPNPPCVPTALRAKAHGGQPPRRARARPAQVFRAWVRYVTEGLSSPGDGAHNSISVSGAPLANAAAMHTLRRVPVGQRMKRLGQMLCQRKA